MITICKNCGKVFNGKKYEEYCSEKCQKEYYYKNVLKPRRQAQRKIYEVICQKCGKKFTTTNSRKHYCDYCKIYHHKESMKKVCPICKKEFITTRDDKIFCSKKCKDYHAYHYLNKQGPYVLKCVICGKEFVSIRSTNQCCSIECRKKRNSIRVMSYYKKKKL